MWCVCVVRVVWCVLQCLLSIVIVLLSDNDPVAAEKAHSDAMATDVTGYLSSKESDAASAILAAFEARDDEALQAATGQQIITFLDNQVAKLAKKLAIEEAVL